MSIYSTCAGNISSGQTECLLFYVDRETHIEQQAHSRSCVLRADMLVSPGLEEL